MEHMHKNRTDISAKSSSKSTLTSYNESIVTCETASEEFFRPQTSMKQIIKVYNPNYSDENSGKKSPVTDESSNEKCTVTSERRQSVCTTCKILLEIVTDFVQVVWRDRCLRLDNLVDSFNRKDVRIFNCKVHIQRTISSNPSNYIHVSQKVIEILSKVNKLSEQWVSRKSEVPKIVNYFKTNSSIFCDVYIKAAAQGIATHLHKTTDNAKCLNAQKISKSMIIGDFQSNYKTVEHMVVPDAIHVCKKLEENEEIISIPTKIRRMHPEMDSNCILSKDNVNKSTISYYSNRDSNDQLPSTSTSNSCLCLTAVPDDRKSVRFNTTFDQKSRSTPNLSERTVYCIDPLQKINQKITEYINHNYSFGDITRHMSGPTSNQSLPLSTSILTQLTSATKNIGQGKEKSQIPFLQTKYTKRSSRSNCTNEEATNYIMKDFYNRINCMSQEMLKDMEIYFNEKLSYNEMCKQLLSDCIQLIWNGESFLSVCDKQL